MDLESRLLRIACLVVLVAGSLTTKIIYYHFHNNKGMKEKTQISKPYQSSLRETQNSASYEPK